MRLKSRILLELFFFYKPGLKQTFTDNLSDMAPPLKTSQKFVIKQYHGQVCIPAFRVKITIATFREALSSL